MCLSKKITTFLSIILIFLVTRCAHFNWKKTCKENQISDYEQFLEKYPDSKYVEEAKKRLDKLAFQEVKKQNTLSAYLIFLDKYPDSENTKKITVTIDSILKYIKTVKLDIKGQFPKGYEFSGTSWHIPERMSQIFEYFDLALQDSIGKSADVVFQIQLKGNSLSGSYSGGISGHHNSGARVSGSGTLERNQEVCGEFEFKGETPPSSQIFWSYSRAKDAPFFSAFAASDLYAKTFSLLNKIYRFPPEELWHAETGPDPKMTYHVKNNMLYVGSSDNHVYAIDAENGHRKWVMRTSKDVKYSPAVSDSTIFVCCGDMGFGKIYALSADNGVLKWFSDVKEAKLSPKIHRNTVYVRSRGFSSFEDDFLFAFNISDGNQKWTNRIPITSKESLMIKDNVLFVNGGGEINTINAENGTILWKFSVSGDASAPVISEGALYIGNSSQHIYALNVRDGSLQWKFDIPGKYRSTFVAAKPIKSNSSIYVKSQDNILYALNMVNGNIKWQFKVGADFEEPVIWNQIVFISSKDTNVYALNAMDGILKWKFHKEGMYDTTPVFEKEKLYVDSQDDYIYALNALDGSMLWKFPIENGVSAICAHQDIVYTVSKNGIIHALKSDRGKTISLKN